MKFVVSSLFLLLLTATAKAHPMGNFSVSHYMRFQPDGDRLKMVYALDLAEIPTFELIQEWNLNDPSAAEIEAHARSQMSKWTKGLHLTVNGRALVPAIESTEAAVSDGAGGMPVVRVTAKLSTTLLEQTNRLVYEDRNFDGRAGWKEIVLNPGRDIRISSSDAGPNDVSHALTRYPADPAFVPPQKTTARIDWVRLNAPVPTAPPKIETAPAPAPAAPLGMVQDGDFLSTLLSRKEIPLHLALLGLGAAFVLGAMHAMSPGHGKTLMAAYLVGSRGTLKHAAFLGGMVTFTHTVSVFLLGLATLFLSRYILPEKIVPWLGAISGATIILIGLSLFKKRLAALFGWSSSHHHHHGHVHHDHDHDHGDGTAHNHHHAPEGEITLASLIALGVSGGLVPCPSALVLLLSAIAIGRTALGLLLLVAFSLGLSLVLMGVGAAVLYAKNFIPSGSKLAESRAFRLVPVVSAVVIVCVGVFMTGVSIGIFKPIGS